MELVITMSKRGLSAIHVIGLEDVPFEAVLGKEVGAGIMKVDGFHYQPLMSY